MNYKLVMVICVFPILFSINISTVTAESVNDRPVIGILVQEIPDRLRESYLHGYLNYIVASYVKFIESGGARVVPIKVGKMYRYYEDLLNRINGVLIPGGEAAFNVEFGYADAADIVYRIAKKLNDNNDYFPVWGIAHGFEVLAHIASRRKVSFTDCDSEDQPLPLEFTPNFKNSRMFGNASEDIISILKEKNVTANFHKHCLTRQNFQNANLTEQFHILSVNKDLHNLEFISAYEDIKRPFYATQFHPEKNAYEWVKGTKIPHSYSAIKVGHYFADFFVNEARKNSHSYPNEEAINKDLIYNYPVLFTGPEYGSSFMQRYVLEKINI